MKRLSASQVFTSRKASLALLGGALCAIAIMIMQFSFVFLIPAFVVAALIPFAIVAGTSGNLADEVINGGDSLIVRKGSDRHTYPITDLEFVDYRIWQSPPVVKLYSRSGGACGHDIHFVPNGPWLTKHPAILELISRVRRSNETEPVK